MNTPLEILLMSFQSAAPLYLSVRKATRALVEADLPNSSPPLQLMLVSRLFAAISRVQFLENMCEDCKNRGAK